MTERSQTFRRFPILSVARNDPRSNANGEYIFRSDLAGGQLVLGRSAFLTLELIPVLYTIWRAWRLERAQRAGAPLETVVGGAPDWARSKNSERTSFELARFARKRA